MNFDQLERDRIQVELLLMAIGKALPEYLSGVKLELTEGRLSYVKPSEDYPGFYSVGFYIRGDLVDKIFKDTQSYILKGIYLRNVWGQKIEVKIKIIRGHVGAIKVERKKKGWKGLRLKSTDAKGVILEPFEPAPRKGKAL